MSNKPNTQNSAGKPCKKENKNEKTATDNQWYNHNTAYKQDDRERKDGPGGENNI